MAIVEYYPQPNSTGIVDLILYPNVVTNDLFGVTMLATFFVIIFLAMLSRRYRVMHVFAASAFTVTVVSYIMAIIPLVSVEVSIVMTAISAVSVIFLYWSEQ